MKTGVEIARDIFMETATEQDYLDYKNNFMSAEEKQIGKPFFEMDNEETNIYKTLIYNNKVGNLKDYECSKCKNRGNIMLYENGYHFLKDCECLEVRKSFQQMRDSGLENLINVFTFNKYIAEEHWQKDILSKAKEFLNAKESWFVMLGESGSGKSHICTAISRELLKMGKPLKYMLWVETSNKLKRNALNDEVYTDLIEKYKNVEVLYIDDFFKSENNTPPSSADVKLANEILNYRYFKAMATPNRKYITIISSERTLEQLLEYDTALAGRMCEMATEKYLIRIKGAEKNQRIKKIKKI